MDLSISFRFKRNIQPIKVSKAVTFVIGGEKTCPGFRDKVADQITFVLVSVAPLKLKSSE